MAAATIEQRRFVIQYTRMKRRRQGFTPTLVFIGPQGSGKGTQASMLARKHHFLHLEMGELLRSLRHKRNPRPFEKKVASVIDKGKLVPSSWVVRLVEERLQKIALTRGIVFDGSARRLREAKALIKTLKRHGRFITHVLYLDISQEEAIRRLSKRWVCVRRHHILTMGKNVRRPTDRCPYCNSAIVQRPDDTPRFILKRLATFRKETAPVATFFRKRHLLTHINGERPVARVFSEVEKAFQNGPR